MKNRKANLQPWMAMPLLLGVWSYPAVVPKSYRAYPVASNDTETGRQLNQRMEVVRQWQGGAALARNKY